MARVDAKLLQIMPKLQILLDKGKVTFNNKNKRKRFRLLNFQCTAILDFMTSLRCLYCWKAEVLLFETINVNVNPGLNFNWSITFSYWKMFYMSNAWCSFRLYTTAQNWIVDNINRTPHQKVIKLKLRFLLTLG